MKVVKTIFKYPKETIDLCLRYPKGYNTSGTSHFVSSCLISWAAKKHNLVELSTAETKYIIAGPMLCTGVLDQAKLRDYGIFIDNAPIFYDNTSAINIAKNPRQHKRTRHIGIRHHFLRVNINKENILIIFCKIEDQMLLGTKKRLF